MFLHFFGVDDTFCKETERRISPLRGRLPFFARRKVAKTRWERQEKLYSFCLPFSKPRFYEGPRKSCLLLRFGALRLSICLSLRMCSPHLRWNEDKKSPQEHQRLGAAEGCHCEKRSDAAIRHLAPVDAGGGDTFCQRTESIQRIADAARGAELAKDKFRCSPLFITKLR